MEANVSRRMCVSVDAASMVQDANSVNVQFRVSMEDAVME